MRSWLGGKSPAGSYSSPKSPHKLTPRHQRLSQGEELQGDVAATVSICLVNVVRYEYICASFFLIGFSSMAWVSLMWPRGGSSVGFEWQVRSRTALLNLHVPGEME